MVNCQWDELHLARQPYIWPSMRIDNQILSIPVCWYRDRWWSPMMIQWKKWFWCCLLSKDSDPHPTLLSHIHNMFHSAQNPLLETENPLLPPPTFELSFLDYNMENMHLNKYKERQFVTDPFSHVFLPLYLGCPCNTHSIALLHSCVPPDTNPHGYWAMSTKMTRIHHQKTSLRGWNVCPIQGCLARGYYPCIICL